MESKIISETPNSPKFPKIAVKGGIISPKELQKVIHKAEHLGLDILHFGSRQDIIFPIENQEQESIVTHPHFDASMFVGPKEQNIMSSYVCMDIFPSTHWIRGTTYLYILEEFRGPVTLKVNIVDPKQQIVPVFSGHLNFIASEDENYWFFYLKLPNIDQGYYPVLVYTWDIVPLTKLIENYHSSLNSVEEIFEFVNQKKQFNNKTVTEKLTIDFKPFPYYEGMNKMPINQYWLGLYWRNNRYTISFLKALCAFCMEYGIGKICLTPWKSFIIKGIHKDDKLVLEKLLGQYGINIRHSSLELNWHLPIKDPSALTLKKDLVYRFDQKDISTYGLTFGINTQFDAPETYFTSIVLEQNRSKLAGRDTFNVLYAKNFDPNSRQYQIYAQDVDRDNLSVLLLELTKAYFKQLGSEVYDHHKPGTLQLEEPVSIEVLQCQDCLTIYDPSVGDPERGIAAGTFFEDLPEDYTCSLCDADLSHFKPTEIDFLEK